MTEDAEKHYQAGTYPGRLTLFRGRGVGEDPELGWTGLSTGGLEIYEIGDNPQEGRREMITEPVVGKLAQQLKICIDRIHSLWGVEKLPSGVGKESVPTTEVENWASREVPTAAEPA